MYDQRERSWLVRRVDAVAPWVVDVGIVLVLLGPTVAVFARGRGAHSDLVALTVVVAALSVLPLLVRRRWPVHSLAAVLVIGVLAPGPAVFSPPSLVGVYTVASRRPRRTAVIAAAVVALAFPLHRIIWGYSVPFSGVVFGIAVAGAALALGLYQATRLAYVEQLHERATRLERERELLARQAAAEERLRIARELHDVVAHNVSLMVIQAQALSATAGDDGARTSAQTIAELGRGAMSEMHRTLELMRDGSAQDARTPQPTLGELRVLLDQARSAGVSAQLSVSGEPRPLGAGVELSAYRIVQEALTNVIKHAGPASAAVSLRYGENGLELEIVDDGRGLPRDVAEVRSGHGLVGMRERVALFGGRLDAGPLNGRGFRVHAVLPYSEAR